MPTELVAESFLLRQLARAYLAAPWALPGGVGRGKTPREQPAGGWPFPVGPGSDGAEEGETHSAGELILSESASAVLAQRGEHEPATGGGASVDPSWDNQGWNEAGNGGGNQGWNEGGNRGWNEGWAGDVNTPGAGDGWGSASSGYNGLNSFGGFSGFDPPPILSPPSPPPVRHRAIEASGAEVTIEYVGPTEEGEGASGGGGSGSGGGGGGSGGAAPGRRHFVMLCAGQWLCASGWHAARREARFERLDLASEGSSSGAEAEAEAEGGAGTAANLSSSNASGVAVAVVRAGWFALRSVATGSLVQVAPPSDAEAWVVRAGRGPGAEAEAGGEAGAAAGGAAARLEASDLELFRVERGGLRNRATRALLNFRGARHGV